MFSHSQHLAKVEERLWTGLLEKKTVNNDLRKSVFIYP